MEWLNGDHDLLPDVYLRYCHQIAIGESSPTAESASETDPIGGFPEAFWDKFIKEIEDDGYGVVSAIKDFYRRKYGSSFLIIKQIESLKDQQLDQAIDCMYDAMEAFKNLPEHKQRDTYKRESNEERAEALIENS